MSHLLSRLHTFAIIVILDWKIHQSVWIQWPFFSKNLNQRSLTPRWPLTPCLLRSHVWLNTRIIVSKSHDNTSMYVDTVINFAKYHIHTHTTYRMSDHIVSYWTQFRRDKNRKVHAQEQWKQLVFPSSFRNLDTKSWLVVKLVSKCTTYR